MTTPYLVTTSRKSMVAAILLTFLLGPIGLFYASVSGGLIMTFTPIFLFLFVIVGAAQHNSVLAGSSFLLLVIFSGTYWSINIIWAAIGVSSYNKRIEEDMQRQLDLWNRQHEKNQNQFVVNINHTPGQGTIDVSTKPNLQDWLKANPGNTVNDYFLKFGR